MVNATGRAIRPFSKMIGIDADAEEEIFLKDTEGDLVPCNFVSVTVSNGTSVGPYYVRLNLSSVDDLGNYAEDDFSLSASENIQSRAGMGGTAGVVEDTTPVAITVSKEDAFNSIKIGNLSTEACNFVITYGVDTAGSTHRGHFARRGD